MKAFEVDCGDCDRVDAVRVSVEITLVTARSPIAAGEYKNRTLSTPPIIDTIDNGFLDEETWAFHRHTVIRRSPATAVDGNILKTIIECCCLIRI